MHKMIKNKGRLKAKKLEKALKSIQIDFVNHPTFSDFTLKPLNDMEEGINENVVYAGKVCGFISNKGEMPW